MLLLIIGIHAAASGADWLQVGVAFGLCLLVSLCVEFGAVHPLAKRWGHRPRRLSPQPSPA